MKIVIDDKIPYIREAMARLTADAVYLKGSEIGPDDVSDADALVVRTRTRCDERLLRGSSVKFIATATIGFDHIDADYLRRAGIEWMSCPGCNAASVAQYVRSVLLLLRRDRGARLAGMTLGIVGCGHVGSKVKAVAEEYGMRVLVNDPPRQERGDEGAFATLADIEREADVVTFHVPLAKDGPHPTFHLADAAFFNRLAKKPVVINTSRGAVVDNDALLDALIYNKVAAPDVRPRRRRRRPPPATLQPARRQRAPESRPRQVRGAARQLPVEEGVGVKHPPQPSFGRGGLICFVGCGWRSSPRTPSSPRPPKYALLVVVGAEFPELPALPGLPNMLCWSQFSHTSQNSQLSQASQQPRWLTA